MGKLSVQLMRFKSLTLPEIMKLVGTFVWEEYELGKVATKENYPKKEANSHTRVVEPRKSAPRAPNSTSPRGGKSGKMKRDQSPN